jgi:hypothetical protein
MQCGASRSVNGETKNPDRILYPDFFRKMKKTGHVFVSVRSKKFTPVRFHGTGPPFLLPSLT